MSVSVREVDVLTGSILRVLETFGAISANESRKTISPTAYGEPVSVLNA